MHNVPNIASNANLPNGLPNINIPNLPSQPNEAQISNLPNGFPNININPQNRPSNFFGKTETTKETAPTLAKLVLPFGMALFP